MGHGFRRSEVRSKPPNDLRLRGVRLLVGTLAFRPPVRSLSRWTGTDWVPNVITWIGDEALQGRGIDRRRRRRGEQRLARLGEVLAQLRGEVHLEAEHVLVEVEHVAVADARS